MKTDMIKIISSWVTHVTTNNANEREREETGTLKEFETGNICINISNNSLPNHHLGR